MHAVISSLLQNRKFWWYLLLTSSMLLHDVIMTSYCCQRYAERLVLVTTLCSSRTVHRVACVHAQLNSAAWRNAKHFLRPTCGFRNSPDLTPIDYEIWAVMKNRVYHKSIVWMNWNGSSSISGAVLNSRFLTKLLTSSEEDIERVSTLKKNILSTACKLTMLTLFISVTFNTWLVWLLHL